MVDEPTITDLEVAGAAARQGFRHREVLRRMPFEARVLLRRLDAAGAFFHRLKLRTAGTWRRTDEVCAVSTAAREASLAIAAVRAACWVVACRTGGEDAIRDEQVDDGFADGAGI